jgi:hypothetical protein
VKPKSITWNSRFLLTEFDDNEWVENFHMNKPTLFNIIECLRPIFQKQNTKYHKVIFVEIWVYCSIYKLAQGVNFLRCSELFAIGKLIVFVILHQFVKAFNFVYMHFITWPWGKEMGIVMEEFKTWCGFLNVQGAIDGTHISIVKTSAYFENYYYHKIGGYSVVVQAIVDYGKKFTNVFMGLLGSVNDARVYVGIHYTKMPNATVFLKATQAFNNFFHIFSVTKVILQLHGS